jgi:hypothetical protein
VRRARPAQHGDDEDDDGYNGGHGVEDGGAASHGIVISVTFAILAARLDVQTMSNFTTGTPVEHHLNTTVTPL